MDAVKPIPERLTPAARARRDPAFAALVSMMEGFIHSTEFTPTELREAVMLAAVNYEMRRFPRPIRIVSGIAEIVEPTAKPGEPPPVLMIDGARYRLDTEPLLKRERDAEVERDSMEARTETLRSELRGQLRRAAVRHGIRLPDWAAVLPHYCPTAKRGTALSPDELQQIREQYPDRDLGWIYELHWENVAFPAPPGPAQPKPATCEAGQYWEANDGALGGVIVPGFASDWHERERLFRMTREVKGQPNTYEIAEREMLGSDLWTYHGTVTPPAAPEP